MRPIFGQLSDIIVGGFTITKAANEGSDAGVVPVRCVANRMNIDRQRERILPEAFDNDTVDFFIKNGIMDWHHLSKFGKTPQIRAEAVIGKPKRFAWEQDTPVVYANLTERLPIVQNSILPNLETNEKILAASVGGKALYKEPAIGKDGLPESLVRAFFWDHLAIAPASYVISTGSDVTLAKAFDSFDDLAKALIANEGVTDTAQLEGAAALGGYDEPPIDKKKRLLVMADIIDGIKRKKIAPSESALKNYMRSRHLLDDNAIKAIIDELDQTL